MKKNNLNRSMKTFTKKWVGRILAVSLIDLQFSYILAWFDKVEIAQDLSKTIVSCIVGVFIAYAVKAFFETKESEKTRILEDEMKRLSEEGDI